MEASVFQLTIHKLMVILPWQCFNAQISNAALSSLFNVLTLSIFVYNDLYEFIQQ
jgi:hypothetical protein